MAGCVQGEQTEKTGQSRANPSNRAVFPPSRSQSRFHRILASSYTILILATFFGTSN